LALISLLFMAVMKALTCESGEGLSWEMLYVDDLVLMAESMVELQEKVLRWKDDGDWAKRSILYQVDGVRDRRRVRMAWNQVVEKDTRECVG